MKEKHSRKHLVRDFLGAYFHEGWICEAPGAAAVVEQYVRTSSPSVLRSLHDALITYVENSPDDAELSKNLFTELGCYYCPEAAGLSPRAWLLTVARSLVGNGNRDEVSKGPLAS